MRHRHQAQARVQQHKRGSRRDFGEDRAVQRKMHRQIQEASLLRGQAHTNDPHKVEERHTPTSAPTAVAAQAVAMGGSKGRPACRPTRRGWATTTRTGLGMIAVHHNAVRVDVWVCQVGRACVDSWGWCWRSLLYIYEHGVFGAYRAGLLAGISLQKYAEEFKLHRNSSSVSRRGRVVVVNACDVIGTPHVRPAPQGPTSPE